LPQCLENLLTKDNNHVCKTSISDRIKTRIQNEEHLFAGVEPNEFQYARIENSVLIPLNQIPQRLAELDPQQDIVVICHHGMRQFSCAFRIQNIANLWVELMPGLAVATLRCCVISPMWANN
jgi:rhodanese-related sulfurtransferase